MRAGRVIHTRGPTWRRFWSRLCGLTAHISSACSRMSRRVSLLVALADVARSSGASVGGGRCNLALPA
eukprot:5941130-Prymnesium_polylepis.1